MSILSFHDVIPDELIPIIYHKLNDPKDQLNLKQVSTIFRNSLLESEIKKIDNIIADSDFKKLEFDNDRRIYLNRYWYFEVTNEGKLKYKTDEITNSINVNDKYIYKGFYSFPFHVEKFEFIHNYLQIFKSKENSSYYIIFKNILFILYSYMRYFDISITEHLFDFPIKIFSLKYNLITTDKDFYVFRNQKFEKVLKKMIQKINNNIYIFKNIFHNKYYLYIYGDFIFPILIVRGKNNQNFDKIFDIIEDSRLIRIKSCIMGNRYNKDYRKSVKTLSKYLDQLFLKDN